MVKYTTSSAQYLNPAFQGDDGDADISARQDSNDHDHDHDNDHDEDDEERRKSVVGDQKPSEGFKTETGPNRSGSEDSSRSEVIKIIVEEDQSTPEQYESGHLSLTSVESYEIVLKDGAGQQSGGGPGGDDGQKPPRHEKGGLRVRGSFSRDGGYHGLCGGVCWMICAGLNHLSKREILKKYRLYILVGFFFVIVVLLVSLGWHYRDLTRAQELRHQKIFFDSKRRVLTLSDDYDQIEVKLGQSLPTWKMPLHCPEQFQNNPNTKECEWRNQAVLRVHHFVAEFPVGKGSMQCYNVSWQTLSRNSIPHDCFDLGKAVWYGPSNHSEKALPIRGTFDYVPTPYRLSDGGVFSSVVDFYWLSSSGVGLYFDPNNPLTVHWNSSLPNHLCLVSNFSGPLYGDTGRLPHMNYTMCNGPDPRTTHLVMKSFLRSGKVHQGRPSEDMFGFPQWSITGLTRKADYDQHDVLDIVSRIKMHGLNCSLLMLDGGWQKSYGDLTFDPERFANLTNMTDSVASTCKVGLQVSPYLDYRSVANFHAGVSQGLLVRDAGGQVPGLTRWEHGPAVAMLDSSLGEARAWFSSLLAKLLKDSKAEALRLSYGREGWLPYKATFSQPDETLCRMRSRMADMVSHFGERLVLEHTCRSQGLQGFVPVSTELAVREGRTCLVHTVEKALTLGLLGYRYVLADGFSVPEAHRHAFFSSQLSADLFTRWMQVAAFFPAFQFSVAPWTYGEETVRLAANLTKLHVDVVGKVLASLKVQQELAEGLPVLRPVWWMEPDSSYLQIHDEFVVGEDVLVAPVLCEGARERDIYVPKGIWHDNLRDTLVVGPKTLKDYHVELNEVPYFDRMPTDEDTKL